MGIATATAGAAGLCGDPCGPDGAIQVSPTQSSRLAYGHRAREARTCGSREHKAVQPGSEQHDQGPVANLDRGWMPSSGAPQQRLCAPQLHSTAGTPSHEHQSDSHSVDRVESIPRGVRMDVLTAPFRSTRALRYKRVAWHPQGINIGVQD